MRNGFLKPAVVPVDARYSNDGCQVAAAERVAARQRA
jgi:hypothetical protein